MITLTDANIIKQPFSNIEEVLEANANDVFVGSSEDSSSVPTINVLTDIKQVSKDLGGNGTYIITVDINCIHVSALQSVDLATEVKALLDAAEQELGNNNMGIQGGMLFNKVSIERGDDILFNNIITVLYYVS